MNLRDLPSGSVPEWVLESIICNLHSQMKLYLSDRTEAVNKGKESSAEASKLFDAFCQGLFVTLSECGISRKHLDQEFRHYLCSSFSEGYLMFPSNRKVPKNDKINVLSHESYEDSLV